MTSRRADDRAALAATVAGLAVIVVVTGLDLIWDDKHVLVTSVMVGPIIATLAATERQIAGLGALALAVAAASGAWNHNFGASDYSIRLVLIAAAAAVALLAARSRRRERAQFGRMALLAELGAVADGSLSIGATAERIVRVLVGELADLAAIDVVRGPAVARLAAGGLAEEAVRGATPPPPPEDATLLPDPDAVARALGLEREAPGLGHGLVVPLTTRGRTLGALTLANGPDAPPLTDEDLEYARIAAGRAALALDNAGLSTEVAVLESQLAGALSNLAEAVTIQDADGKVVFANEAAADLLGFRRGADVVATPTPQIVASFRTTHPDGRPLETAELPGRRVLAGENPEPMLVRVENRATGEERWRIVKATAVRDPRGRVQFAVNVVEDVTEVKRAELTQRLLAEASRVLSSSLDPEETLARVAQVVVPDLADWCTVHMPTESGQIGLVAVAHADPDRVHWAREVGSRFPGHIDDPGGLARVIREGTPELMAEIPPEALEAMARSPEHLDALRESALRSAVAVPMEAGGRAIGAITLVNTEDRRPFGPGDVEIAQELGRRAGVAVENARLYKERAYIAETLQRDLLPPELPAIPGWATAALYRPAEAADVGGDFYDAFPVERGWILVVGDVAGRGPAAASLTAMARHTLRTAAMLTGDAAAAVRILNRALADRPRLELCSVCVVQLHEGRPGEVTIVAAGHPDPFVIRQGAATPVAVGGPLLGALQDSEWPAVSVRLDPGDRLVLYTDGVIDAVGPDDRFGEARLASTLSREGGAAELVEHMRETLEAFSSGRRRDDTALLALERLGARPATAAVRTGGEGSHHVELPAGEEAPAIARRFVDGRVDGALADRRLADVRLLVSELVTNAVLHATRREGDVLDLDVVIAGGHVRVEVHDPGPGFSPASKPAPPPVEATTGRGLMLVDRIANRWGVDRGRRTCVWFEIDRA